MFKALAIFIVTVFCVGIALIPETVMYFVWSLISPQTVIEKILMLVIFWFGGIGLCIAAIMLAIFIWFTVIAVIYN